MNHKILICLSFLMAVLFIAGGAFAITCTSDSTKTITLGSSELITVSCSGMSSGDNVEVTHSGYNPNCLTSSTSSKTLTYAAPSTTFSFDGLSTACQGNVAERTIGWSFDDGTNTYSSSTVATLSPLEITASFDSSSVSKTTSESAFYVTLTVSNAGSTAVSNVEVTETTSTGLLSSKTITSIPAQSSQSVSWSLTPSSVGVGTYSITARAKAPTTDATTDSMTLTITTGSTGDDTPGDTSSPGSSPGGAPGLPPAAGDEEEDNVTTQKEKKDKPDQEKVTASNRPKLVPGVGLRNNEKLQAALEKVLGRGNMNQNAIQNMLRLSASITANIETQRNLEATDASSKVTTRMKYNGKNKAKNFVIYEKIPKSFAESTDNITVNTNGQVEIVEEDPEYAIIFSELNPDQTIEISYTVNQKVDASVIDAMTSEVYAESIEEPPVDAEPTTTEQPKDKKTSPLLILAIVLALVAVAAYIFIKKRQKQSAPKRFVPAPIRQPENPKSPGSETDTAKETDNTTKNPLTPNSETVNTKEKESPSY